MVAIKIRVGGSVRGGRDPSLSLLPSRDPHCSFFWGCMEETAFEKVRLGRGSGFIGGSSELPYMSRVCCDQGRAQGLKFGSAFRYDLGLVASLSGPQPSAGQR